jgi:hypothetical protein
MLNNGQALYRTQRKAVLFLYIKTPGLRGTQVSILLFAASSCWSFLRLWN